MPTSTASNTSSALSRTLKLASGASMPQLGFGTWNLKGNAVEHAMVAALDAGYRHFDFAMIYENQKEMGTVLAKWRATHPEVTREHFFFTSKLWNTEHRTVRAALEQTLRDLQLDTLDLYLIHWPLPQSADGRPDTARSLVDTWRDMVSVQTAGLAKHIGVSNFAPHHLQPLLDAGLPIPAVNQIEVHPLLPQTSLLAFCARHKIAVTAYSPLGSVSSPFLRDPALKALAEKHACTVAQLLLSWGLDQQYAVIPKSANPERMLGNTRYVMLSPEAKECLDKYAQTHTPVRVFDPRDLWGVDLFNEGEKKKGASKS